MLPGYFSNIFKNLSLLVGAGGITALCGITALSLNTRSLGPHEFGVLALIQTYAAFIGAIATFESWQPVIRLGVRTPRRIGLTVSTGIMIDIIAAIVATVVAITGILIFGELIGIDDSNQNLAIVYSSSLLAGVAGTPKGFFRLRNRFDVLVGNQIALAVAMLGTALVLWWFEAPLNIYIITFAAIAALYNISLLLRLAISIKKEGSQFVNPLGSVRRRRIAFLMMKMGTGSSLFSTFSSTRRHVALLIVGGMLGEAAAGQFAFAARLASAGSKLAQMVNQVVFSEILQGAARFSLVIWRRIVFRITLVIALIISLLAIVAAVYSLTLVKLVGGVDYSGAASIFSILFTAECIGLAAVHLNPVIQQRAGTRPLVHIAGVTMLIYLPLAVLLSYYFGTNGGAIAVAIGALFTYGLMIYTASHFLRPTTSVAISRLEA